MKLITAGRLNRLWKEGRKEATTSAAGLMSAKDKKKLDGIKEATPTSAGLMSAKDKEKLNDIKEATTSAAGLMSAKDKEKLDGIDENLMTSVDAALSLSSANPVQNKAVAEELGKKAEGEGLKFSVVGGILTVTYQE